MSYTKDEIVQFNNKLVTELLNEKNEFRYDGLLYFVSCHGNSNDEIIASDGDVCPLEFLFNSQRL